MNTPAPRNLVPGDTPTGSDDIVLPFAAERLQARGRIVRLSKTVDKILRGHDYPDPVSRLLGEAIALGVLLGTSLRLEGRFILQTKTDGPVPTIVVDFETPDRVRAWAQFDEAALAEFSSDGASDSARLLGNGHLALTIDHGSQQNRYQGLVPLEDVGLSDAADLYFAQSEQIPTLVRLAVAEELNGSARQWRAGGILVQHLPEAGIAVAHRDLPPGDLPDGVEPPPEFEEDDQWVETRALAATIEDHELIDPGLAPEQLLYRLFHENGVRVFEKTPLRAKCRCSKESVAAMLKKFDPEERADMVEAGEIYVDCQFCSSHYVFSSDEIV
jgi:molecular chaperone Hsp33